MAHFAAQSPGARHELLLINSTPVECARSRETIKRSALAELAGYGYCASRSRFFWRFRLHLPAAPDDTPQALSVAAPSPDEREVGLELLTRCRGAGCELLICDKGYARREFAAAVADMGSTVARLARKDEPGRNPHLVPNLQRIESIFWTCKNLLTLERYEARTMAGLRKRILCHAAYISLDHRLNRASCALVDYWA